MSCGRETFQCQYPTDAAHPCNAGAATPGRPNYGTIDRDYLYFYNCTTASIAYPMSYCCTFEKEL